MSFHLVSIGVSSHQNSQYSLRYAADDAKDFYQLISSNINGLGYAKLLVDSEATYGQIKSALGKTLAQQAKPEDTFIFFFSGHGTIAETVDGKHTSLYLVPFDVADDISASCLSVLELKDIFNSLSCKTILIFIDSCFSGYYQDSKFYPNAQLPKGTTADKTFENTIKGSGKVIFTASDGSEKSYEDSDYKKGVFTYHLLDELQKDRKESSYNLEEIYEPVKAAVLDRVRHKYHKDQTPQFIKDATEEILIPSFRKKLKYVPELISIPSSEDESGMESQVVEIQLSEEGLSGQVKEQMNFVQKRALVLSDLSLLEFEDYCAKIVEKIKTEWERIFIEAGNDVSKIPSALGELEGASFEFIMLGATVISVGSKEQVRTYAEYLSEILRLREGKAGYVSIISIPEIIVVECIYITGIVAITRNDYEKWAEIIGAPISLDYSKPPKRLVLHYDIFYADALEGNALKVHAHLRQYLGANLEWLKLISPRLNTAEKLEIGAHQANYLLTVHNQIYGERMYADFARYGGHLLMPLINKILYNPLTRKQISKLFGTSEAELNKLMREKTESIAQDFQRSHYWDSISPEVFGS